MVIMELNKIYNIDCIEGMKKLDANSVDAIVTDGPYGLEFMGKSWDKFEPNSFQDFSYNWALEALRVLKPGGYILSFGGARTYHRMACAIEDAGFEIRDMINWVYGSGFPKSMNIGKAIDRMKGVEGEVVGKGYGKSYVAQNRINKEQGFRPNDYYEENDGEFDVTVPTSPEGKKWSSWGTALKPSHEPIVLARKPLSEKSIAENVLKWGTGGLNIDGCRIPTDDDTHRIIKVPRFNGSKYAGGKEYDPRVDGQWEGGGSPLGRFPANFIHDGSPEIVEQFPDTKSSPVGFKGVAWKHSGNTKDERTPLEYQREFTDSGSAARFFYCAKASDEERNMGCDRLEPKEQKITNQYGMPREDGSIREVPQPRKNHHPTVKPIALMRYLCKLITPPNGLVLDPFIGSGTTAIACKQEGFNFIGFEISEEYFKIAEARLKSIVTVDEWL